MPALLRSLRPRQWTKNLLLFAPLLFAQKLADPVASLRALAAFAVFCLLSGAVYLFNDLLDLESDRLHPVKSKRPIAAGEVSRGQALAVLGIALVLGLGGAFALSPELLTPAAVVHPLPSLPSSTSSTSSTSLSSSTSTPLTRMQPSFLTMALTYLALQLAYTWRLKHVVILDAMVIALGFVVRAVAGAAVIAVDISHWLLICTIFLSLFLALAKRRHEILLLQTAAGHHRPALAEYDAALLDQMIAVVSSACLISYALYTMAPDTIAKFGTDRLNVTIPFVIYGLFRYLYLIHRRADGGDPSASLLADRPLLASVVLWALTVFAVLYS